MWDNYKPTKAERAAIETAWYKVYDLTGHDYRSAQNLKDEARGYGFRGDSIGKLGAMALCVKWYFEGPQNPETKLSDFYFCRPAAIWFRGYGASKAYALSIDDEAILAVACAAHESAFSRMLENNKKQFAA